jgi:mono/diheme cytochrome c family protein
MGHSLCASDFRNRPRFAALSAISALFLGAMFLSSVSVCKADPPDPQRGRALYENHCQFCHSSKVHVRPNKLPLSRSALRNIVDQWQKQQALSWTEEDTQDVVEYLDRTHYHFPPAK